MVDGPLPDHPRAVVLGTGAVLDDAVARPQLVVEELAVVLVLDVERVPPGRLLVHVPPLDALAQQVQVLADPDRLVADRVELGRERDGRIEQADVVLVHTVMVGVEARQERGTPRAAEGRLTDREVEGRGLIDEEAGERRRPSRVAPQAPVMRVDVVEVDDDDVGPVARRWREPRRGR